MQSEPRNSQSDTAAKAARLRPGLGGEQGEPAEMSRELFDIIGKRVLITGSSRGLGWSMANGLAEAGAAVILNGTDERLLAERVTTMREAGFMCHAYPFDVTDESKVEQAVARIEKEIGGIDVLVNCAGINRRSAIESFSVEDWKAVIDVNLNAVWMVSKHAVRGMIERKAGKVINIASLLSFASRPTVAAYAASKAGVAMLTKSMAVEWAKYNIQVNAIAPGYLLTDMTAPLAKDPEFDAWVKLRAPAERWGDPKELNGLLIFFASDASSYVTGQVVAVDGGWTANL